jgi:phage terminase large subunit GpA-like protein
LQIDDVDEEYFSMLTSEHCVQRFHKGVPRREWVLKKGQRKNEALDIFVYNFVALKILNPNFEVLEKNMNEPESPPLKKVNKPYKIRREGSFVNGFR